MEQLLMDPLTCRSTWSLAVIRKDLSTESAAAAPVRLNGTVCPISSWAMNKQSDMTIPKNRKTSKRLDKKTLLFRILTQEPDLTTPQLQTRAYEAGLQLTMLSAYRALRTFKQSGGKLENSETRCLKAVASVLQDAAPGEHLTAVQIRKMAIERGLFLHQTTVYRVLARLRTIGLVSAIDKGRQKLYEWTREEDSHGHLTCIQCGKTIEFHQDYLDDIGKQISTRLGYDFSRIEFIVRSLCDHCRNP